MSTVKERMDARNADLRNALGIAARDKKITAQELAAFTTTRPDGILSSEIVSNAGDMAIAVIGNNRSGALLNAREIINTVSHAFQGTGVVVATTPEELINASVDQAMRNRKQDAAHKADKFAASHRY